MGGNPSIRLQDIQRSKDLMNVLNAEEGAQELLTLGNPLQLEPAYPNPQYKVVEWGTRHKFYANKEGRRIPWSNKEIQVVGSWFANAHKNNLPATPSRFIADVTKNHVEDIVPFVHKNHALSSERIIYGFKQYLSKRE